MGTEFADNKSLNEPFPAEWGQAVGAIFGAECEKLDMLVRVSGDNIMLCPSFIESHEELNMLIDHYGRAVRSTEEKLKQLKLKSKQ